MPRNKEGLNGFTRCYYTDAGFTTPVEASNYTAGPFYCHFAANGYRLPTEGEWEYVCRAETIGAFSCNETNYSSGSCSSCTSGTHPILGQYCVFCENFPGTAEPLGEKFSNPWNLKDIHGNVWEWCWDWYGTYLGTTQVDYSGLPSGFYRTLHGGGWNIDARYCRSANRGIYAPGSRQAYLGFRLVRTID